MAESKQYRPVYRARIGMKAPLPRGISYNGEQINGGYREFYPGDEIVGSELVWPTAAIDRLLRLRHIERIDGNASAPVVGAEYMPPRPTTAKDMERAHIQDLGAHFPAAMPKDYEPKDRKESDAELDAINAKAAKVAAKAPKLDPKAAKKIEAKRAQAAVGLVAKGGLAMSSKSKEAEGGQSKVKVNGSTDDVASTLVGAR